MPTAFTIYSMNSRFYELHKQRPMVDVVVDIMLVTKENIYFIEIVKERQMLQCQTVIK